MNANQVGRRLASKTVISTPVRAFGGGHGHGHDEHHEEHTYVHQASRRAAYKIPTQHDYEHIIPSKPIFSERLNQWIAGRWPVDREAVLDNTNSNKYSAYYWFRTNPL
jgi:hypothetical protein